MNGFWQSRDIVSGQIEQETTPKRTPNGNKREIKDMFKESENSGESSPSSIRHTSCILSR